jgi:hypothetical protein
VSLLKIEQLLLLLVVFSIIFLVSLSPVIKNPKAFKSRRTCDIFFLHLRISFSPLSLSFPSLVNMQRETNFADDFVETCFNHIRVSKLQPLWNTLLKG